MNTIFAKHCEDFFLFYNINDLPFVPIYIFGNVFFPTRFCEINHLRNMFMFHLVPIFFLFFMISTEMRVKFKFYVFMRQKKCILLHREYDVGGKWERITKGRGEKKIPTENHITVPPTLSICCRRWVSVWSKSLPVRWSRPWNYLITTLNSVANCCLLIGQHLTAMTIWWEMIYPPAIFSWVMSPVKMITSFNHALFGWIGVGAK